jgi:3-phenylpropionate/trans-cinnamate dioxygenase ferredoxin reductase subunit
VTVLEAGERILQRVTVPEVSDFFRAEHEAAGVVVREAVSVDSFVGKGGRVCAVRLGTGESIPAELVLVGIGLIPNVEPLKAAGARGENGIDVDLDGRTSLDDVYAIGDCSAWEHEFTGSRRMRLESVQNANSQAKRTASHILGLASPGIEVPWFWSNQYEVKFKTMGMPVGWDEYCIRGNPDSGSFSVAYLKDRRLVALDSVNNMRDYAQAKQLIRSSVKLDPSEIAWRDLRELSRVGV